MKLPSTALKIAFLYSKTHAFFLFWRIVDSMNLLYVRVQKETYTLNAVEQFVEACATNRNITGCLGIEPTLWPKGRLGL